LKKNWLWVDKTEAEGKTTLVKNWQIPTEGNFIDGKGRKNLISD
jgi:hypothetical protein